MPGAGLEPARGFPEGILSLAVRLGHGARSGVRRHLVPASAALRSTAVSGCLTRPLPIPLPVEDRRRMPHSGGAYWAPDIAYARAAAARATSTAKTPTKNS